ncbi:MAG: YbgC/FadM family acyl-CoA thioesterase [Novosphingobium sp.]|nr:YbgC/FadM family acyl-CoA thioesterase [Novosphingobium sp.]
MPTLPTPPEGHFDGRTHRFPLRVYFDDTDAGGVVYHANYLRWFERGRSELIRSLGLDQPGAIAGGQGAYAVTEMNIRYLRPARLGDAVTVETRMTELRAASWRVEQRALRGSEVLAEASVRIGFVAPDGRPARHPAGWHGKLQTVLAPEGIA